MARRSTLHVFSLALALGALPLSLVASGCSDDDKTSSAAPVSTTPPLPGPAEWNRPVTIPSDDEASTGRTSCKYKAGTLPDESQGTSAPRGGQIPIENIVVVMMENRSFDHYFQKAASKGLDVEVAPDDFSNKDPAGNTVKIFRDTTYCIPDPAHGWSAVHGQVNGGAMDGFVTTNAEDAENLNCGTLDGVKGDRAMAYYEEEDIPFMYWVARNFSIGDHYHSSVVGPTWPNRMYLYAASSFGRTSNVFPKVEDVKATIFDNLNERKISWKIYKSTTPGFAIMFDKYMELQEDHVFSMDDFYQDAAAGTLPQVTFVDPGIGREGFQQNDEHPPAIMEVGQNWLGLVTDAMTKSPLWAKSATFVTYDEHGGFYDHVAPPKACPPDDLVDTTADPPVGFDTLGVRVPFLVISPFAKKGFVGHHVYDHTSIVRFIEARYTMPAMTGRDANAEIPWEMFDFEKAPNLEPPTVVIPPVDQAKLDKCTAVCEP